jgi:hypothetical protein
MLSTHEGLAQVDMQRMIEGVFLQRSVNETIYAFDRGTALVRRALDRAIQVSANPALLPNQIIRTTHLIKDWVIPRMRQQSPFLMEAIDWVLSDKASARMIVTDSGIPYSDRDEYAVDELWFDEAVNFIIQDEPLRITQLEVQSQPGNRQDYNYRNWTAPQPGPQTLALNIADLRDELLAGNQQTYDTQILVPYKMSEMLPSSSTKDGVDNYIKVVPGVSVTENVTVNIHGPFPLRYSTYEDEAVAYTAYSQFFDAFIASSLAIPTPIQDVLDAPSTTSVRRAIASLAETVEASMASEVDHVRKSMRVVDLVVPKFLQ